MKIIPTECIENFLSFEIFRRIYKTHLAVYLGRPMPFNEVHQYTGLNTVYHLISLLGYFKYINKEHGQAITIQGVQGNLFPLVNSPFSFC